MEAAQDDTSSMVDAGGLVAGDVSCRRCAYNLRGLNSAGRCPECGTAIGVSIRGDLLRYADPQWVGKLRRGAKFSFWGILVAIVVESVVEVGNEPAVSAGVSLVGGLLGLYGAWLLTEPDAGGLNDEQYVTARRVVRVALMVGFGLSLLQIMAGALPVSRAVGVVSSVLEMANWLVEAVGEVALLAYLGLLALRIPAAALAKRARFLMWAYGASAGAMGAVVVVIGVAAMLSGRAMGLGAISVAAAALPAAAIALLAVLVSAVMMLFLLRRMGKVFGEQERLAREMWGGE